jgi:hypothetical protein
VPNLSANVTNKTIADFYREALPIHRELREAQDAVASVNGRLRNVYKKAKESGVSEKAIARLLKERLLDPDEVTKDLHDYVRARAIISPMPKHDVDMFTELLSPAVPEDTQEAMTAERGAQPGDQPASARFRPRGYLAPGVALGAGEDRGRDGAQSQKGPAA